MEVRKSRKHNAKSRTKDVEDTQCSYVNDAPSHIVFKQCDDLYRLKDDVIRSVTKQQSELREQNTLLKKECEGLLNQLEVRRVKWRVS